MAKNKKDLIIHKALARCGRCRICPKQAYLTPGGFMAQKKTARKIAKELEKIRKVPTKTNVTAFIIDVEQHGVFGDIKVIDDPCDV